MSRLEEDWEVCTCEHIWIKSEHKGYEKCLQGCDMERRIVKPEKEVCGIPVKQVDALIKELKKEIDYTGRDEWWIDTVVEGLIDEAYERIKGETESA